MLQIVRYPFEMVILLLHILLLFLQRTLSYILILLFVPCLGIFLACTYGVLGMLYAFLMRFRQADCLILLRF